MYHNRRNGFSQEYWIGRACEEVQDSFDLLSKHGRIVLNELVQRQVLQILENCGYRNTGPSKHPGSADLSRNAFKNRAF